MGKLDDKKKQKRDSLLMAAFTLFTQKGINDTSISDIAKKANMAKGTFYLYFKDKFDIHDRLIEYQSNKIFEIADEELNKADCKSLEECVIFIADNIIGQLEKNPALLKFSSKNLSWAVFSNIRIAGRDNKNCMDIFEEIIHDSGRKFGEEKLMVFMIVELINSTCYNVILSKSPVEIDELKPELYETIRRIISQFEILPGEK